MKSLFVLLIFSVSLQIQAQNYTSFKVGSGNDISTNPEFGICLMGGATENDNAMQWLLNRADSGDVLVLRTSGSDGYNDYMMNQLGVNLNSVETLVIHNENAAADNYVLNAIAQAEVIWFAGGDQADYVNFFKDNAIEDLLDAHINTKQAPIGGTSAGMAILGEFYFDALNGTVTSSEAMSDPMADEVSIGKSDFLDLPFLSQTITDTHYDNPDRRARHTVFLSRIVAETGERAFGIGVEEYTAVVIDETGQASVFGDFPNFDDFAYFIQANCLIDFQPETLMENTALTWDLNNEAVKAYKISGTSDATNTFNLNSWLSGSGGSRENWWVNQGEFFSENGNAIDCEDLSIPETERISFTISPNPFENSINIQTKAEIQSLEVFNLKGQKLLAFYSPNYYQFDLNTLNSGIYLMKISTSLNQQIIKRIIKE
ncbi:T9SS type A sorting domain-containing protein [Psychroflexus aestuariivivens]|uniref:T9SS type A sorting domain-containing protein n=1 Tax=Psychroflexus aestuariivivens TaxID=1795040 RepID=UPI000FD797A9|nr:T9SS type A sorting domain-containing protein [Psychroflexus aestuariivivens]